MVGYIDKITLSTVIRVDLFDVYFDWLLLVWFKGKLAASCHLEMSFCVTNQLIKQLPYQ